MNVGAFIGWQNYSLIAGMFMDKKKKDKKPMNLTEYRESLGLLSDAEKEQLALFRKIQQIGSKAQARKNIEKAENILSLDRARAEKGR